MVEGKFDYSHADAGDVEVSKTKSPEEIHDSAALSVFFETVFRNNPRYSSGDEVNDKKRIEKMVDEAMETVGGKDRFLIIKDEKEHVVATARLTIEGTVGHLSQQTVEEKYRKQGLGKELTDVRERWAREAGCTELGTRIFADNPVSLHIKLKEGFTAKMLDVYVAEKGVPKIAAFVLTRPVDENAVHGEYKEKVDYPLGSLAEIKQFMDEGWEGVECTKSSQGNDDDVRSWRITLGKI